MIAGRGAGEKWWANVRAGFCEEGAMMQGSELRARGEGGPLLKRIWALIPLSPLDFSIAVWENPLEPDGVISSSGSMYFCMFFSMFVCFRFSPSSCGNSAQQGVSCGCWYSWNRVGVRWWKNASPGFEEIVVRCISEVLQRGWALCAMAHTCSCFSWLFFLASLCSQFPDHLLNKPLVPSPDLRVCIMKEEAKPSYMPTNLLHCWFSLLKEIHF